ncbi:MAG TPA: hypothetical protein VKS43_09115 [Burkholderiales bacterium]|nr:hypothetical protein [Burkholderiales bacterium]
MTAGRRACVLFAAWLAAVAAYGQAADTRTLELDGGASVTYALRTYAADAHLLRPAADLAPDSALNAAKLLNLYLSIGDIEAAALLSNSPRRRFELLRDYREKVGAEEFKRVFAQYFAPENRLVAEIIIGNHSLLVWDLRESATRIAGQYFVEIDGRYFIDDTPNEVRSRLQLVLAAYRSGKLPGPHPANASGS